VDHLVRVVRACSKGTGWSWAGRWRCGCPGLLFVGLHDGAQAEVFDLQDQDAPARVQHDEVGVQLLRADGHVVPEQVVVVELLLQPFSASRFSPLVMRETQLPNAGINVAIVIPWASSCQETWQG
jgi:hypothetical protein